jgi:hypothetical protein
MNNTLRFLTPSARAASLSFLTLGGLSLLAMLPAQAQGPTGLVFSLFTGSPTAPGGSGVFDVLLTDSDPGGSTSYQVAAFSYELTTTSDITFGSATADSTGASGNSYIFTPVVFTNITSSNTGQDLIAGDADFADASGYKTLNPGDTYSVGDISYTVAAGATPGGSIPVSFANVSPSGTQATSLSDPNGNLFPVTATDGSISVSPSVSVAPEPSSVATFGVVALFAAGLVFKARRRQAVGSDAC